MCARKENRHPKRRGEGQRDNKISTHLFLTENEREVTSGDKTGKESIRILERSVR